MGRKRLFKELEGQEKEAEEKKETQAKTKMINVPKEIIRAIHENPDVDIYALLHETKKIKEMKAAKGKGTTKKEPEKVLNLRLPEDYHRAIKIQAAMDGLPVKQLLMKLIKTYCEKKKNPIFQKKEES
jgi:predicted DNA binding CopG/RHH family protein